MAVTVSANPAGAPSTTAAMAAGSNRSQASRYVVTSAFASRGSSSRVTT